MHEEQTQDQALATFTDLLLTGQLPAEAERPAMCETIETLARVLSPQPPPEHLKLQIRRQIIAEWSEAQPSLGQRLLKSLTRPRYRWVWGAVAALVVVAVTAALFLPAETGGTVGTAWGEGVVIPLLLVVLALGLVSLAAWWISRRR